MISTGPRGIYIIKDFEGLRLTSYLCPAGVWTVGYGHTKTAKPGMTITLEKAEELLRGDLRAYERNVNHANVNRVANGHPSLTQNQFDALVSFDFNTGGMGRRGTGIRKAVEGGADSQVPVQMLRWTFATTASGARVRMRGLERRREAEAKLWSTPE